MALTKSQILQGINDPKEISIKSLDDTVWLRPLSNAELDEIDQIEAKMMESYETNERANIKGKIVHSSESLSKGKLNMVKAAKYRAEARDMMICKSLDNPRNKDDPWDLKDVGKLRRETADELVDAIQKLSGINVTQSDIEKFPEDE